MPISFTPEKYFKTHFYFKPRFLCILILKCKLKLLKVFPLTISTSSFPFLLKEKKISKLNLLKIYRVNFT